MDQVLQRELARMGGEYIQADQPDTGSWMAAAWQLLRYSDAAHRRCGSDSATVAHTGMASAVAAAYGRDDHRTGEQLRTPHATHSLLLRIPMPDILA